MPADRFRSRGGPAPGKAGKFSIGALNVQTAEDRTVNVDTANFTVLRAKRDILRRSSVGAMLTHRTTLVGRPGSNDGYGADATFSFFQNLRMDTYLAQTRTDGRNGGDRSYRGLFDYNADKYGVQAERLEVGANFNPEIGFVRRLDMRRNYGLLRYSPRPRGIPHVRKLSFQGSLNYTTNTTNRLDTRESIGQFQTEFTNSDLAIVSYTPHFERLVGAVPTIAPGSPPSRGRLRLSHHAPGVPGRPAARRVRQCRATKPARSTTAHARRSVSARRASR